MRAVPTGPRTATITVWTGRMGLAFAVIAATAVGTAAGPAVATSDGSPPITLYAGLGNGDTGAPVPGPATASPLKFPSQIAADPAGDIVIADQTNNTVEKVTADGILSVIAGTGVAAPPAPGLATRSPLDAPTGVAIDAAGDVYIADQVNHVVEKVTSSGVLSVIAGTGTSGTPVPGPAAASPLGDPHSLAVDPTGDLYIGDDTVVEEIDVTGLLSVVAGNGSAGTPVAGPATASPMAVGGIALDRSGTLYLADYRDNRIDDVTSAGMLSAVAGTGSAGSPVPGPATSSAMNSPLGVSVDAAGNLHVADSGNRVVEEVTPAGRLSIIVGNGSYGGATYGSPATGSPMAYPTNTVSGPDGSLFISETLHSTIDRVLYSAPGPPSAVAGAAGPASATLTWVPPADTGGDPVTSYLITPVVGGVPRPAVASEGPGTTATVTGLDPGVGYTFTVDAVTNIGRSTASAPSGLVTPTAAATPAPTATSAPTPTPVPTTSASPTPRPTAPSPPGAPTAVLAAGGIDSLTVRWTPPADAGVPALTGYRVTVTDRDTGIVVTTEVPPVTSTVLPATEDHRYDAIVTAVGPAGTGPDSTASATVMALPRSSIAGTLAVYRPDTGHVPVVCQVTTGRIRSCYLALTTVFDGRSGFIGNGQLVVHGPGALLRALVAVTLPPRGRALAARIGGFTAVVHSGMRVVGSQTVLVQDSHRIRVVAATVVDRHPTHFKPGSSTLSPAGRLHLSLLRRHLGGVRTIVCTGYTDGRETAAPGVRLGLARAEASCTYLVRHTHLRTRILGLGGADPIGSNGTVAGRTANRRVIVTLRY